MKWDAQKSINTRWQVKIPGLAHSSPVVWGDQVFITTAVTSAAKDETRYGLYGDVAPVKHDPKHTWKVYALDKQTGKILWERVAYEGVPLVKRHPKSTHADSTPVTDGKYLVALLVRMGSTPTTLRGNSCGSRIWVFSTRVGFTMRTINGSTEVLRLFTATW